MPTTLSPTVQSPPARDSALPNLPHSACWRWDRLGWDSGGDEKQLAVSSRQSAVITSLYASQLSRPPGILAAHSHVRAVQRSGLRRLGDYFLTKPEEQGIGVVGAMQSPLFHRLLAA